MPSPGMRGSRPWKRPPPPAVPFIIPSLRQWPDGRGERPVCPGGAGQGPGEISRVFHSQTAIGLKPFSCRIRSRWTRLRATRPAWLGRRFADWLLVIRYFRHWSQVKALACFSPSIKREWVCCGSSWSHQGQANREKAHWWLQAGQCSHQWFFSPMMANFALKNFF